jgi:quinoprotein glucose dehydrogenase
MIQRNLRVIASYPSRRPRLANARVSGQSKKPGEWPTYGGDLASTRYSPLDQITKENFNKLEVAWRFKTDALGPRPEFNFRGHR